MLEARVKADCKLGYVQAFSGLEFNKKEWKPIPAGGEAEALRHPYLETREAGAAEKKAAPAKPAPVQMTAPAAEAEMVVPPETPAEEKPVAAPVEDNQSHRRGRRSG